VQGGVDLVRAVRAASAAPARALGIDDEVGTLAPGLRADVVAVDGSLQPLAVWRHGRRCDTEEHCP
jgi:N-acetylglucosamine-6-phosphate deacetylase